jgi:hypothetical protein
MVSLTGWTSTAAAQGVPACSPEKTLDVKLTTEERGDASPLVATHEAQVSAEISSTTVGESITPPADVQLTTDTKGTGVYFIVPSTPSVALTVSWRQAIDPADPESDATDRATSCVGTRVVTLPIVAAQPGHVVRLPGKAWTTFLAAVPALKRPDLSPLTIAVKTSARAAFPAAGAKAHTMVVPMLTASQVKYPKPLPGVLSLSRAGICRVYWLTCGAVSSTVSSLELDTDALSRGVEKPDLGGAVRLLARTQPARSAVRYGAAIDVFPGGAAKRPFGYDVEVRQSGRVLAHVRRAGECHDQPAGPLKCSVSRGSTKIRESASGRWEIRMDGAQTRAVRAARR